MNKNEIIQKLNSYQEQHGYFVMGYAQLKNQYDVVEVAYTTDMGKAKIIEESSLEEFEKQIGRQCRRPPYTNLKYYKCINE